MLVVEQTEKTRGMFGGGVITAMTTLLLMAGSTAKEASAKPAMPDLARADTIPAPDPLIFEGSVLFSPNYLTRAVEAVIAPTPEKVAASVSRDVAASVAHGVEGSRAAAYASRYGISRSLALQIIESALAEGLDPELGFRLIRVESVFKINARGPGGSLGLTQLMPSTARSIDRSLRTDAQILDPVTNLRTGFRYLRVMIDRYDGNVRLGVLAYNRGEVAVDRAIRAGRDPENGYSVKVLGSANNRYSGRGVADGDSD